MDSGLEGYRKERIWYCWDTGKEVFGSGGIQDWRDLGWEGYRITEA